MDNKFVLEIGAKDQMRVAVTVENTGEIAYQASFFLVKPSYLIWQQSDPVCTYFIISTCYLISVLHMNFDAFGFGPNILLGLSGWSKYCHRAISEIRYFLFFCFIFF